MKIKVCLLWHKYKWATPVREEWYKQYVSRFGEGRGEKRAFTKLMQIGTCVVCGKSKQREL